MSFEPDWTINPCGTLAEIIAERGWSIREVAERTWVSKSRVDQYLHGDPYPASWAVAFASLAGCSPAFIWNLQCVYQLDLAMGRTEWQPPERDEPDQVS